MAEGLVIIPTYNEIENIEAIVRAVFSLPRVYHVLVVDDSSPDGTAGRVEELQGEFPEALHLEVRQGKTGLGTAYIHLAWIGLTDWNLWYALPISVVWVVIVMRWG